MTDGFTPMRLDKKTPLDFAKTLHSVATQYLRSIEQGALPVFVESLRDSCVRAAINLHVDEAARKNCRRIKEDEEDEVLAALYGKE